MVEAASEAIPIIGPLVGELLFILASATNAKRILELGTAIGYSAMHLARACETNDGRLISIDESPGLVERARANLSTVGLDHRVDCILGEALATMRAMDPEIDLIFMDIDKEDYLNILPECHRLLRPGGLLFVDNVAFKDAEAFNQVIHDSNQWSVINLYAFLPLHAPEKDGLCLALKL